LTAALIVSLTGVLAVLLSFGTWGICPTTPCGGFLQAISEYLKAPLATRVPRSGLATAQLNDAGRQRAGSSS